MKQPLVSTAKSFAVAALLIASKGAYAQVAKDVASIQPSTFQTSPFESGKLKRFFKRFSPNE
jgi:hypothetical protein